MRVALDDLVCTMLLAVTTGIASGYAVAADTGTGRAILAGVAVYSFCAFLFSVGLTLRQAILDQMRRSEVSRPARTQVEDDRVR
jgi:hypothetical protein